MNRKERRQTIFLFRQHLLHTYRRRILRPRRLFNMMHRWSRPSFLGCSPLSHRRCQCLFLLCSHKRRRMPCRLTIRGDKQPHMGLERALYQHLHQQTYRKHKVLIGRFLLVHRNLLMRIRKGSLKSPHFCQAACLLSGRLQSGNRQMRIRYKGHKPITLLIRFLHLPQLCHP